MTVDPTVRVEDSAFVARVTAHISEGSAFLRTVRELHKVMRHDCAVCWPRTATWSPRTPSSQPEVSTFPSLAPEVPAAAWYEREIHDLFGLVPVGHPRLDPLVLPLEPGEAAPTPGLGP